MPGLFQHKLSDEQVLRVNRLLVNLRSGYYKQTYGKLMSENPEGEKSYCCLGVACDLSNLANFEYGPMQTPLGETQAYKYLGEGLIMPTSVRDYYGFSRIDARYYDESPRQDPEDPCSFDPFTSRSLPDWNDRGRSFTFIANEIEKELALVTTPEQKELLAQYQGE